MGRGLLGQGVPCCPFAPSMKKGLLKEKRNSLDDGVAKPCKMRLADAALGEQEREAPSGKSRGVCSADWRPFENGPPSSSSLFKETEVEYFIGQV